MGTTTTSNPTTSKSFKLAEVSDIHLGHPKTPTWHILQNLKKAFPDTSKTGELDMIILAGDIFDGLFHLPDAQVTEIRIWINQFLRMCKRRDIVVRVLEGTPSHDWGQPKMFEEINEIAEIHADCRYIDKLSIEENERFGYSFLYVPDEWRPDPNQTWREVEQLLREHNLEMVDFSIMHGFFPHQMPAHLVGGAHDPDRYLAITRKLVFIGHVHDFSQYDRIYAGGSFDRLAHNEEEPKGYLLAWVEQTSEQCTVQFVENENAMVYKTIDVRELDSQALSERVDSIVPELPEGSHVRLHAYKGDAAASSLKHFEEQYPQINWTPKFDGSTMKRGEDFVHKKREFKTVRVHSENIVSILQPRLEQNHPDHARRCVELLEDIVDGQ